MYLEGVSDTRYPELSAQASRYLPFPALQAAVFGLGPSHREFLYHGDACRIALCTAAKGPKYLVASSSLKTILQGIC